MKCSVMIALGMALSLMPALTVAQQSGARDKIKEDKLKEDKIKEDKLKEKPQEKRTGKPNAVDAYQADLVKDRRREFQDMVSLLPWSYKNGKNVATQSAREICNQLLLQTGFNVLLVKSPVGAMPPAMPGSGASNRPESPFTHVLDEGRALLGQEITGRADAPFVLPTAEEMEAIGEKLQTRYVLAGRAEWKTRNVWVGVANRAKATCTVDIRILDMESKQLVLDAKDILGDSTEQKNMFGAVTSIVALNPLPLVLPGSVTPEEQRAVVAATTKAMAPWLRKQRIYMALGQADRTAIAAAPADKSVLFSPLVSSPDDLRVNLHITTDDSRPLAAFDPDLAKLAVSQDIHLAYRDPNRLRLDTDATPEGMKAIRLDEETRRFITVETLPTKRADKQTEHKTGNQSDRKQSGKTGSGSATETASGVKNNQDARQSGTEYRPSVESDGDLPPVKTGQQRKIATQNLAGNPSRRLSTLDLCGRLTTGMFDYFRARFVRQEKLNGQNTVVYDLTYWNIEDSPYRRVWLDPTTKLAVKQELYDKSGKLKNTLLYQRPVQLLDQSWIPTRIEMEDSNHKRFALIILSVPRSEDR